MGQGQFQLIHLLLIRGGDLRHMGGGGSILLGGLNRRGGGRGQGANTAVAVISWPSICPAEKRDKTVRSLTILIPVMWSHTP